jgi:hypothetical protein
MKRPVAIALGLLTLLAAPALAEPDGSWTPVNRETVRFFMEGTVPPANADLAPADRAATLGNNQVPATWLPVSSHSVRTFIAGESSDDTQLIAKDFQGNRTERTPYLIESVKQYGEPQSEAPRPDPNPAHWGTSQSGEMTRYTVPLFRIVHTPYRLIAHYGWQSRNVARYRMTYRTDRYVHSTVGSYLQDTHTFTRLAEEPGAWQPRAYDQSLDRVLSSGVDDSVMAAGAQSFAVAGSGMAGPLSAYAPKSRQAVTFTSDHVKGTDRFRLDGSRPHNAIRAAEAWPSVSKRAPMLVKELKLPQKAPGTAPAAKAL